MESISDPSSEQQSVAQQESAVSLASAPYLSRTTSLLDSLAVS